MPVAAFRVRAWVQPIMRNAAAIKYGVNKLYFELQAIEAVYRRQEFLIDYRSYTTAYERGAKLKFVRRDYKPSARLFSEAKVGMRKTYKYNVESKFIDRAGGTYSTRSSFVTSDRQLTRGEIEDIVRDRVSDIAEDYDCPTVQTTLTEAWHRKGDYWD